MGVVLGEDERLRDFWEAVVARATREEDGQAFLEGADDGADLGGVNDIAVEAFGVVVGVLVLLLPALPAGEFLAELDEALVLSDDGAALGDLGLDAVDVVPDVDAVDDGLLVWVLADDVLVEVGVGALVGRGGQGDLEGVEVLEHLLPEVVDRAVTLVDDDEVEQLGRDLGVVLDGHGLTWLRSLGWVAFLVFLGEVLAPQDRVHALDGGDADVRT